MQPNIPSYAFAILSRLESEGHRAYLVGGCVRDMLRGKKPKDIDITTDALPSETQKIFPRSVPTGEKYGTVTVFYGKGKAEVTTFRTESGYTDSRRPDGVVFVRTADEDLSRRDFTVNAMAMDLRGNILDLFGGREDLCNKIIRCVGNAENRFSEDALRMLRAVRFSAQLGFSIDPETEAAIIKLAPSAKHLSRERVRAEMLKTLLSDNAETAEKLVTYGLLSAYTESSHPVKLAGISLVRKEETPRLAYFTERLYRSGNIPSPGGFLRALGFGAKTTRLIAAAIDTSEKSFDTDKDVLRNLRDYGREAVILAASIKSPAAVRRVNSALRSDAVWSTDGLALGGRDLVALGIEGKRVGECLQMLLSAVIEDPAKNNRENLLAILAACGYNKKPTQK